MRIRNKIKPGTRSLSKIQRRDYLISRIEIINQTIVMQPAHAPAIQRTQTERVSICVGGCENIKPNETWSNGEIPYSSPSPPLALLLCARAQAHRHSLCSTWEARVCFREKPANKYKWLQQPNTERGTLGSHCTKTSWTDGPSSPPMHVNHSEQTMAMMTTKSRQTRPFKRGGA